MKLITEYNCNIKTLVEKREDGNKDLYIEGIFLQAEAKNRNGRIYPVNLLEREVNKYNKEYVKTGRAMGELNHPDSPIVDPKNASHLITALEQNGNDFYGRAKILNTPNGNIVRGLLEGGVKLGVSSRGMGTLKRSNGIDEVQSDYVLSTVDIVADPSAPKAFVNGIMEGVDWIYENGVLTARDIEEYKKEVESVSEAAKEEAMLLAFEDFIKKVK
jgi:hypothetical protein